MTTIDVTDRLTPGAKALVKMRTADMIRAANVQRGHYYRVGEFFAGAWHGRKAAELVTYPTKPTFNDAWSGNPDTDRAWAHDIMTGGR